MLYTAPNTRFLAGDMTLYAQISGSAASGHILNPFAHHELQREDLDDAEECVRQRLKFDLDIRERRALAERLELENQRLELENQRLEIENRLALLNNCINVIQFRNALSELPGMSATDMQFMTNLCNRELSAMAKH
eukprot:2989767-Rhodomonas_salina.2